VLKHKKNKSILETYVYGYVIYVKDNSAIDKMYKTVCVVKEF
jgi:hypothetical protein